MVRKVSPEEYAEFEQKYWQGLVEKLRFGQAFMNKFGFNNADLDFNLFYEEDTNTARDYILANLVEYGE